LKRKSFIHIQLRSFTKVSQQKAPSNDKARSKNKKNCPENSMRFPRIVARSCSNIDNRRLLQFIGPVLIFELGLFKSGNTRHRTGRLEIGIILGSSFHTRIE
jgi:hypothetical protein